MALLNALAYSTSLTHLICIFFSEDEENLQVLVRSSGACGSGPEAGGHGQVWGRVLWLRHAVGLTVAMGCLTDRVLQPNHSKWDLHEVVLLPAKSLAFTSCPLPRAHAAPARGPCQPMSHRPGPCEEDEQSCPTAPSWAVLMERHTHAAGTQAFFHLGTEFFQR